MCKKKGSDVCGDFIFCWCFGSYRHHQASGRQILRYLGAVDALLKHGRVVVHVGDVDEDRGDVSEGRPAAASLHRQVVLSASFEIQRGHQGQEACRTTR